MGFLCLATQAFIIVEGGAWRMSYTTRSGGADALNHVMGINYINDLSVIYVILYTMFGLHMLFIHVGDILTPCCFKDKHNSKHCWLDCIDGDAFYILLSCTVKILLSWLLISAIYRIADEVGSPDDKPYMGPADDKTDWEAVGTALLWVFSVFFVVGFFIISLTGPFSIMQPKYITAMLSAI